MRNELELVRGKGQEEKKGGKEEEKESAEEKGVKISKRELTNPLNFLSQESIL